MRKKLRSYGGQLFQFSVPGLPSHLQRSWTDRHISPSNLITTNIKICTKCFGAMRETLAQVHGRCRTEHGAPGEDVKHLALLHLGIKVAKKAQSSAQWNNAILTHSLLFCGRSRARSATIMCIRLSWQQVLLFPPQQLAQGHGLHKPLCAEQKDPAPPYGV